MSPFKSKKAKVLVLLIVFAVLVAGLYVVTRPGDKKQVSVQPPTVAEVRITPQGFEPSALVVKKGTKIIWTNVDEKMHQVASNPHPSHDSPKGLKSEILNNDQTYEYDAKDTGTFGYHDEQNPTTNGTIEIKE